MFHTRVYSKDWITQQRKNLGNCDPALLEKSIYALTLLGHLCRSGLPFIFKGGTSLMLHLPTIQRLSIDIDIVCPAEDAELERVVAEIGETSPFHRQVEDNRGIRGLPQRRHFKFFFHSPFDTRNESAVLLDVVQEKDIVHSCTKKPIQTSFLQPDEEIMVELPTIESLLGDKLTAFAPTTTGVPLRRSDGSEGDVMQVAKQLFDVGILFDHAEDIADVAKTYDAVQAQEAGYREEQLGKKVTKEETLNDTFNACLGVIASKPKIRKLYPDTDLLLSGFSKLRGHLNWPKFSENDQRTLAAKTAFLAWQLKGGVKYYLNTSRYLRTPEQLEGLKAASLNGHELNWIDGIRAINDEAYYYLHEALKGEL
jgi:hypothetical protein